MKNVSLVKLFLFALLAVVIVSCRKGELPEEFYFGNVSYSVVNFPNTPRLAVFFNGKQLDTLGGGGNGKSAILEGKGNLSFYIDGTKTLIADTIITIDKNSNLQFRVACNEQFNLKGFVPERPQIGPDTAVFQLYFQLGAYYQQYPRVDLTFMYQDANTGEIINELTVNGVETTGKLHPGLFRMRVMDETQNPIYYVVEMKDPATGEVITIPPYDEPFFGAPGWSPGNFGIMSVDADKDGAITTNGILFDY